MSWVANTFIIGTAFFIICSVVVVILILYFVVLPDNGGNPPTKPPTKPPVTPDNPDNPLDYCKITSTTKFTPLDTFLNFGTNPTILAKPPPFKYEESGVFSYSGDDTQLTLWIKLKSDQSDWVVSPQVNNGKNWINLTGVKYSTNGVSYQAPITVGKKSKIRLYLAEGTNITFDVGGIFELTVPKES